MISVYTLKRHFPHAAKMFDQVIESKASAAATRFGLPVPHAIIRQAPVKEHIVAVLDKESDAYKSLH